MRQALGIGVVMAMLVTPAMASFFDSFSYPDGPLGGNDGWSASTATITVQSGAVKIAGGTAGNTVNDIADQTGGVITVGFQWKNGVGDSSLWNVLFDDSAGVNLARYYGTATSVRGRMGGTGTVTDPVTVNDNAWHNLKIVIDTVANSSTFYLDGGLLPGPNPLPHSATGAGDILGSIKIDCWAPGANDSVLIDNLYTPEPATLALLALGALFVGRRRART